MPIELMEFAKARMKELHMSGEGISDYVQHLLRQEMQGSLGAARQEIKFDTEIVQKKKPPGKGKK